MFGSFLPSLGCLAAIKSTHVEGADSVMKSSEAVHFIRKAGSSLLSGLLTILRNPVDERIGMMATVD
jgi:hypothetical protein